MQQPDSTKRCSKCGEEKPRSEFHRNKSLKDGLCGMCKPCNRAHVRTHYRANREEILAKARDGNSRQGSPEHREKISIALKGKPKSAEHVEKVRQALIGRKPSPKVVAALRATNKRIADERLKAMLESGEKHCPKCGEMKPLTEFGKHPKGLGGFACWCLPCGSLSEQDRRRKNPDVVRARDRESRKKRMENPAMRQREREYYHTYRSQNAERIRMVRNTPERREKKNAQKREKYRADAEFRELMKMRAKDWVGKNPERRNEISRNYDARKRSSSPAYCLAHAISKAVWDGLTKYGEVKNKQWLDVLGYDPVPSLLKMGGGKPGMSVDHCIPQSDFLARIGTDYPTAKVALRAAWQLGNLRVIPKRENCAKGAKRTLLC